MQLQINKSVWQQDRITIKVIDANLYKQKTSCNANLSTLICYCNAMLYSHNKHYDAASRIQYQTVLLKVVSFHQGLIHVSLAQTWESNH